MNEEDILQAKCWQWSWNYVPETRYHIWHVPNGKSRRLIEAVQLKAMGVLAGVDDIHCFWQGRYYILELKVGSNILSDKQERYKEAMTSHGAIFYEVRDFETYKKIILKIVYGDQSSNTSI